MGIKTVAIYSDADQDAVHVKQADEAYPIGPAPALQSYLNQDKIIEVALTAGVAAIHPGYGFLAENPQFAQACSDAGIIFVGPPPAAIAAMGSKIRSKRLMVEAGVPVLPGYHGDDQSEAVLLAQAQLIGFPLLIKASSGGGGKGMRVVNDTNTFIAHLHSAKREAQAAFGDDAVLLERYLQSPKHIEVQIMADSLGNAIHLFERDCSVQRRHQKVIEEAPGPEVSEQMRQVLGATAIMAAQKVGYVGAGTVEFIVQDNEFFFMEMNTRLQVEHPVTEAITGIDLVAMQLEVAAGKPLSIHQEEVEMQGHAVEVRLYAEKPYKKFLPSTGSLLEFEIGDNIRVDTGVMQGSAVSMHYDPMLAKLIAHGATRAEAIDKLCAAIRGSRVVGIEHNLGYLCGLLQHPQFLSGQYTTSFAGEVHDEVVPEVVHRCAAIAARQLISGMDIKSNEADLDAQDSVLSRISLRQGKHPYQVELNNDQVFVNDQSVQWSTQAQTYVRQEGDTVYVVLDGHTEKFIVNSGE